jgi:hypothetical protein
MRNSDYIVCLECNKKFCMISNTHLKYRHDMTIEYYKNKWNNPDMITDWHIHLLNIGKKKLNVSKEKNPFYGKHHSEETKQKIRLKKLGRPSPMKGIKRYDILGENNPSKRQEVRNKISIKVKKSFERRPFGHSGKYNPCYIDGRSFELYGEEWNNKLKEKIRKRDNHICQYCGISQDDLTEKLIVHHIDYNKKNNNENNLVSVCRFCHAKKHGDIIKCLKLV